MLEQTFAQMSHISVGISRSEQPVRRPVPNALYPREPPLRPKHVSMTHGVCPPLTAKTKRPRPATAARASAAMMAAACLSHRLGICKYFNFHEDISNSDRSLAQSGSASLQPVRPFDRLQLGPQVWGSYSVTGVFAFSTGSTIRHASST